MFGLLAVIYYACMAAGLISLAAVTATAHKLRKWARELDFDFAGDWLPVCIFIVLIKVVADLFGGGAAMALLFGVLVLPAVLICGYFIWHYTSKGISWLWRQGERRD